MGNLTYGDVLAGRAAEDELAPFGGEQAHKAFALAVGLQLLVDALTPDDGFGAVLARREPAERPGSGLPRAGGRRAHSGRSLSAGSASSLTAAAEKHGCPGTRVPGQCWSVKFDTNKSFQEEIMKKFLEIGGFIAGAYSSSSASP